MSVDWNEAQLRGIDLRELLKESPTHYNHTRMIKSHEAKAKIYWDTIRFRREIEAMEALEDARRLARKMRVKKPKRLSVVAGNVKAQVTVTSFTETQMKIAISAEQRKTK